MLNLDNAGAAKVSRGLVCLLLVVFPLVGYGEEMPVPAQHQVPLILKILTYDRNFSQKMRSGLRIGIVYNPWNSKSHQAHRDLARTLDDFSTKTIKKLPIQYIPLKYRGESELAKRTKAHQLNLLYIMPGNKKHLPALIRFSQAHQITTVTGVPDYVKKGIAVGIGVKKTSSLTF